MTPTGLESKAERKYRAELCVEWVTGEPVKDFDSEWTEYGKLNEPKARAFYEFRNDCTVDHVGMMVADDGSYAGSPDGLVGEDGGLELKCVNPTDHLLYLSEGVCPREYVPQVQGCLWISGREWWDFMSWHRDFPPFVKRVYPDERWHAALSKAMPEFLERLAAQKVQLREAGIVPASEGK